MDLKCFSLSALLLVHIYGQEAEMLMPYNPITLGYCFCRLKLLKLYLLVLVTLNLHTKLLSFLL